MNRILSDLLRKDLVSVIILLSVKGEFKMNVILLLFSWNLRSCWGFNLRILIRSCKLKCSLRFSECGVFWEVERSFLGVE